MFDRLWNDDSYLSAVTYGNQPPDAELIEVWAYVPPNYVAWALMKHPSYSRRLEEEGLAQGIALHQPRSLHCIEFFTHKQLLAHQIRVLDNRIFIGKYGSKTYGDPFRDMKFPDNFPEEPLA